MKKKRWIIIFVLFIVISISSILIINKIQLNATAKAPDLTAKANYLENYLKDNKQDIDTLLELALTYSNNKEFTKSKDIYKNIINQNSNNVLAWQRLGNVNIRMGLFSEALDAYNEVVKLDPTNPSGYFYLSQVLLLTDLAKAQEISKKSLDVAKANNSDSLKYIEQYYLLISQLNVDKSVDENSGIFLKIIRDDFITFDELKIALIDNIIQQQNDIKNMYTADLLRLRNDLEKNKM